MALCLETKLQAILLCQKMSQRGGPVVDKEGIFTPGEKESTPCGRRSGQLREYEEDVRIGRKKIRKAKAQPKLNLATVAKDNIFFFRFNSFKHFNSKRKD